MSIAVFFSMCNVLLLFEAASYVLFHPWLDPVTWIYLLIRQHIFYFIEVEEKKIGAMISKNVKWIICNLVRTFFKMRYRDVRGAWSMWKSFLLYISHIHPNSLLQIIPLIPWVQQPASNVQIQSYRPKYVIIDQHSLICISIARQFIFVEFNYYA